MEYTMAANPGPGILCHKYAKESDGDSLKKHAPPRKRKLPADMRTIVNLQENYFPILASLCIRVCFARYFMSWRTF